jgi:hypothetical protein
MDDGWRVFKSRNVFDLNIPSPKWPLESHFNNPESVWPWANTTWNGGWVPVYLETPSWNWLVMNPERINHAWGQIADFIRTGWAAPGNGN